MEQHLRRAFAGRGGLQHVFDDVVLCVSELVTTAVEAHSSIISLTLDSTAHSVRLAMTDRSPDSDAAAQVRLGANGHRARILDAVATRWGVDRRADGNEIWIEFALTGAGPRAGGLATRR